MNYELVFKNLLCDFLDQLYHVGTIRPMNYGKAKLYVNHFADIRDVANTFYGYINQFSDEIVDDKLGYLDRIDYAQLNLDLEIHGKMSKNRNAKIVNDYIKYLFLVSKEIQAH